MNKRFHFMKQQQKGATLVELVMTIVIISVSIAGVVGAFSLIAGRSADPLNQTRAVALAQLYHDELISTYYDPLTPLGGGRVDAGVTCDELHRELVIENPYAAQGFGADYQVMGCVGDDSMFDDLALNREDIKRIKITITDPAGQQYVFGTYRGNF
jgi:MSHA pilin protein MshD